MDARVKPAHDEREISKMTTSPRPTGADEAAGALADQCDDSPGAPVSGWISAAIMPLDPGP